jgi:hypothetical protein
MFKILLILANTQPALASWANAIDQAPKDVPKESDAQEWLDRSYVTRVLCLAFIAPEITKAVLGGQQPTELTAKQLIKSGPKIPLL